MISDIDRFWRNVTTGSSGECWPWIGYTDRQGYGRFPVEGKLLRAHAISWELAQGRDWPDGLIARHSCDNPGCVNPAHVTPGTHLENMRDRMERNRDRGPPTVNRSKTHCIHGHELNSENLSASKYGYRHCRICARRRAAEARQRAREIQTEKI